MSRNFIDGSVRQYFARLELRGQSSAALAQWHSMPVESFFLAMTLPASVVNPERREGGLSSPTLGALFEDVRWD